MVSSPFLTLNLLGMTKTKKFRDYNPKQVMLLPPSVSDWLRPGHPVYFVSEVVTGLTSRPSTRVTPSFAATRPTSQG